MNLSPLTTDGPIFLSGGRPWRWKGVSAFKLLELFARGEDISGFLDDFAGFNVLRVFWYTPRKDWGDQAWGYALGPSILKFCAMVGARGWYVELTMLTDDDPFNLSAARDMIAWLSASVMPPNLLIEASNEPQTHKAINTAALRSVLASAGVPHSSGDYEDSRHWYGTYGTAHTGRDQEWVRRAHDLLDYRIGGGPNFPEEPACKVPWVADEPIRPDQAGFNEQDFRAYFGACALLGAGGTYHYDGGKFGRRPTADEARIAAIVLEALNHFPAEAPKGAYSRPDEGTATLRTYRVGPYTVRIRPTDGKVFP